ncbi:hypothetical protein H312_00860 [Anncaliia algerae PRA339]|uniref:Uncharacterized protein n=1 Tax=Anncaliia algerae PRA339 TaxID=1288291 RepID=A0A059F3K5_9MICR|nr:hypothetical protein H312_00860 [Anncaliia algerae PRA339]
MRSTLLIKAFKKTINETLKSIPKTNNKSKEDTITKSLTDVFNECSKEQIKKLDQLDDLLKNEVINLRDIRNKDYINEIFDSYVFNDKLELINKITEVIARRKKIKSELIGKLENIKEQTNEIEKNNQIKKEKFNMFVDSVYDNK